MVNTRFKSFDALESPIYQGLEDFSQNTEFDFDRGCAPANFPPAFRGAAFVLSVASFHCFSGETKSLPLVKQQDKAYVAQG